MNRIVERHEEISSVAFPFPYRINGWSFHFLAGCSDDLGQEDALPSQAIASKASGAALVSGVPFVVAIGTWISSHWRICKGIEESRGGSWNTRDVQAPLSR